MFIVRNKSSQCTLLLPSFCLYRLTPVCNGTNRSVSVTGRSVEFYCKDLNSCVSFPSPMIYLLVHLKNRTTFFTVRSMNCESFVLFFFSVIHPSFLDPLPFGPLYRRFPGSGFTRSTPTPLLVPPRESDRSDCGFGYDCGW